MLAEPLSVALHAVHRAGDVAGRRVLVTGAGPIGCLVTAVLSHRGAAEVIVSDLLDTPLGIAVASGPPPRSGPTHPTTGPGRSPFLGLLPPREVPLLGNVAVTRELELRGAFRFDTEFDEAITLLARGLPVDAIETHTFPLSESRAAFDIAHDRAMASKVLLDLSGV